MTNTTQPDNAILIVLDTCRASTFFELLDQGKLPQVEWLLDDAAVFENAKSVAPWTVPSHASIFSGLYPSEHGTSANNPQFDPTSTPLAQRFSNQGFATFGLSANPWVTPGFGFDQGFDRYKTAYEYFWDAEDLSDIRSMSSRKSQVFELLKRLGADTAIKTLANIFYEKIFATRTDSGAARLTSDAIEILRGSSDNTFVFLNYMEPHLEYNPPEHLTAEELPSEVSTEQASRVNQDPWEYIAGDILMDATDFEVLEALYRAEMRYLDSQLGRLFEFLDESDKLEETCIILVGDHGENIGDHNLMDHQYCLYETLLHVPLAMRYPKSVSGTRIQSLVETRWIYHTLSELIGDLGSGSPENSLMEPSKTREFTIAEYPDPQPSMDVLMSRVGSFDEGVRVYDRALRSVQKSEWKLIQGSDGHEAVYNLREDPDESNPIQSPSRRDELRRLLYDERGEMAEISESGVDVDNATRSRLEDLGYL